MAHTLAGFGDKLIAIKSSRPGGNYLYKSLRDQREFTKSEVRSLIDRNVRFHNDYEVVIDSSRTDGYYIRDLADGSILDNINHR